MHGGDVVSSIAQIATRDHDLLTGLGDDDHTQYLLKTGSIASITTRDHHLLSGLGDDDHTIYVLRSILTTNGDIFIRSGGVVTRLAQGASNTLLGTNGSGIAYIPQGVLKTAVENVNNSIVLQNDDHLFFSVEANKMYYVRMMLRAQSPTLTGLRCRFSVPAGADMKEITITWNSFNAEVDWDAADQQITSMGATEEDFTASFLLYVAATSGTCQLQWAQWVATAENTQVNIGSFLRWTKLN